MLQLFGTDENRIKRIRSEHADQLTESRAEIARSFRSQLQKRDDEISELRDKVASLNGLKLRRDDFFNAAEKLVIAEVKLDNREALIALREQSFDKVKQTSEEDIAYHHKEAVTLNADAEGTLKEAKTVLADAKSVSRAAGRDEGYAAGLKDGFEKAIALTNPNALLKSVNLATVAASLRSSTAIGSEPSAAEKTLAEAFARHLTGVIDSAMQPEKDSK